MSAFTDGAKIGDMFGSVAHIGLIAEQLRRDNQDSPIALQVNAIYRNAYDALTVLESILAAERRAA